MKNTLFNNWNPSRFIRLTLGLYLLIDGIRNGMWSLISLGALFTLMPLLYKGCCAASGCVSPKNNSDDFESGEVIYEEVKTKKK